VLNHTVLQFPNCNTTVGPNMQGFGHYPQRQSSTKMFSYRSARFSEEVCSQPIEIV